MDLCQDGSEDLVCYLWCHPSMLVDDIVFTMIIAVYEMHFDLQQCRLDYKNIEFLLHNKIELPDCQIVENVGL